MRWSVWLPRPTWRLDGVRPRSRLLALKQQCREGIQSLRTPVRAPRANAIAECWIGTVRRELLDQMLIANRCHLETVLAEYVAHFNDHRPHRALSQAAPLRPLPQPAPPSDLHFRRHDRLGGLIHEYAQVARRG